MGLVGQQRFAVLIGDLQGSRVLEDREGSQERLIRVIGDLNANPGIGALETPLVLTAGDEVQCVFRDGRKLVETIQELTDRLHESDARLYPAPDPEEKEDRPRTPAPPPDEIAFGIGRGTISTGPILPGSWQDRNPAHLDGPAFHAAKSALGRAKDSGAWVCFEGFRESSQLVLNALFELMGAIRSRWSTKQWIYCYGTRKVSYQKTVAALHGVSPSVVSESLKAANYRAILSGEEAARRLLEDLGERD